MNKKLIISISSIVALIGLVTSLLLLIPGACKHEYDHVCDGICNLCEEERIIEHVWKNGDCTTPKTCTICKTQEGEALGHDWVTPDVDQCEVQSICSRCGATEGEHKEHVYDNDCDVACNECNNTRIVQHDYSVIQKDELYHWYACSLCERPDGENKVNHVYDNDCDISCNICLKIRMTEHIPDEDDGDCTTAITCFVCGDVTTAAKSVHIPNGDDGDCTTAVSCSVCNQIVIEAKSHDFSGTWEEDASGHWHVCKNDGCFVIETKEDHISDGAATEEKAEKCIVCEYIITPELEHTHNHNIPKYNTENHWLECACGKKTNITVHTANDDGDCTTAITCLGCSYVTTAARTSHEAGADDGDCTTPIICKHCTKIAVAGYEEHVRNNDDGDCTTSIDCSICGTIITPVTNGHSAEPDDYDCTTEIKCVTCEKVLVEARNEHTGGMATCGAKAVCEFCNTPYGELDPDNHFIIDDSCACGEKWYIDATEMTAEQLNAAVTEKLEAGETDIEIVLASDAPAEMITAIRRAICDTEGVVDGSINLTLKGVTVIPDDPKHEGVGFAERWGQWDENNVKIVTDENVTQLASITLPDVLTIGYFAFACCENLTKVIAPKVQTIGWHAFQYTALTTIEFPELTTIPYALFAGTSTLTSAKFPNVSVVENGGLLIGGAFKSEFFLLELTTEGDITFNGDSHFNVSSQNYSDKVDLVLHANKHNEVTFNDDGTATWKGYTFKSISFVCLDGTTNHDYQYFINDDETHSFGCDLCGVETTEAHNIVDGKCECGAMEITIGTASIARWVNDSVDEQRMLVNGDSFILHLFNKDDPTKTEVHIMTYDGEKWNTIISSILPAYFVAYIGDGVTVTSPTEYSVESFISNKDQSTFDSFNADDVVIATGDISVDGSLDLFFEHQYAKVTFNVELASQFDSMKDYISKFYVVTYDGYYVNPYVHGKSYTAVIPANPYFREGVHFALVTINGEMFEIEIPDEYANPNGSLLAGIHYIFDYKLGNDKIIVEQVVINDIVFPFGDGWDNEEDLISIEIGDIQDIGKNAWKDNDQIIVSFTSNYYGTQIGVLTYYAGEWSVDESLSFYYLENETPVVSVFYAPCYDVSDDVLKFKAGMQLGMTEYIMADCVMDNLYSINITFENSIKNYSRLRIVGQSNTTYTVTVTDFTPAGTLETGAYVYTITTDSKGNAYLYGVFSEDATATVKKGNVILTSFIFSADKTQNVTEHDKSYVLDARAIIDGTFGGKSEATYEDVNALVEQLKAYVDNGITTIFVTGSEPAIIYSQDNVYMPAVPEALYQLSGGGYYEENNPYYGTIDLIMFDTTEVAEWEFFGCYVLNSIYLPKVTTVGDASFTHCTYLRKITFGSVVNCIIQEHTVVFYQIGSKVGGCDLVLNCGQMQGEDAYKPDLVNNVWFIPSWSGKVTWNSITLIHTGECDECQAN